MNNDVMLLIGALVMFIAIVAGLGNRDKN